MEKTKLAELAQECEERVISLFKEGRYKDALILGGHLVNILDPDNETVLQIIGLILYDKQEYKKAIEYFKKTIEINPNNSENLNNISLCYSACREFDKSIPLIQKAIELNPKHIYFRELGVQYANINEMDKAVTALEKAIEINPQDHKNWSTLGSIYGNMLQIDQAIKYFQKALEIKKDPEVEISLSYGYFLKGEWEKAWEGYEKRLEVFKQMIDYFDKIYPKEKRWMGEDLTDKKLVVYCEQGAGDFINFIRFLPELKNKNCTILLHSPKDIKDLWDINNFGDVRKETFKTEEYDYHCSLLSLPFFLKINNFKKDQVYIKTNKAIDFSDYKNFFKIGITWGGSPLHPNDRNRSCYLSYFKNIFNMPNVKLFGLQKDIRERAYIDQPDLNVNLTENCDDIKVVLMSDHMESYDKTAAILNELDLIITVDTSILHLAGAMGKEVWALIPFVPDWRWGINTTTQEWYPNVQLFRQTNMNNWDSVFKEVEHKLEDLLQNK